MSRLDRGWRLALTAPDAILTPAGLDEITDWIPAGVPGTAASALSAAGRFDRNAPWPIGEHDVWYVCDEPIQGPHRLRLAGLATLAEAWLGADLVLHSNNMFLSNEIDVPAGPPLRLSIRFWSLEAHLQKPGKRARWRPAMIKPATLNAVRTTILGHAAGWCPPIAPVGPWREIALVSPGPQMLELRTGFDSRAGIITCRFRHPGAVEAVLRCAGQSVPMQAEGDMFSATLQIADAGAWWPHTHGTPALHEVEALIDGNPISLGRVGFRNITVNRGADGDGFAIACNGVPIFCRGACWTPADLVALPSSRDTYRPRLELAVAAGMNMLRVGGTMVYEAPEFFALCDELGILVWQDFMFANFDYPAANPDFIASVEAEATQFLRMTQSNPSLTVLSGGSEVYQQAAMMGLPIEIWRNPIFEDLLPACVGALRPDVPYVVNSPSGGPLPFVTAQGVSHYYGVGAYRRPLEDARRARVRFTSECLAFANIPEESSIAASADPQSWQRAPRDAGADWDFADISDHYLRLLLGADRSLESGRYREASRAAVAHVVNATFSEWRRPGSGTGGALVWFFADLTEGAGWGVIDASGEPKSIWYAMRECLRPVQVLLTDEGVNGLDIHALNETDTELQAQIRVTCLRDGAIRVADGVRGLVLPPRSGQTIPAVSLFGAFFDTTYAYRFGPPAHGVVAAELLVGGEIVSTAAYFPQGLDLAVHPLGLSATLQQEAGDWWVDVSCTRFANFVQISGEGIRAEDNWFHLAPHAPRRIRLLGAGSAPPCGSVRALNGNAVTVFSLI